MLIDFIHAAMRRAKYQVLAENEGFVGTIPGFRGLLGHSRTLEGCRDDLYGALQTWLLVKLRDRDRDIPTVDGISLTSIKASRRGRSKSMSPKAA
jgi:predicted RNase H-like HicB family nuclease